MPVQPYLYFHGRCEEALDFYRRALGAEVNMMMRFKDSPEPTPEGARPPGTDDKIMHAQFTVGDSILLASDGCTMENAKFEGISLSLTVRSEADADRSFKALADGGQVQMPLTRTFFSPRFGMVADRFGVSWIIYVAPQRA